MMAACKEEDTSNDGSMQGNDGSMQGNDGSMQGGGH